MALPRNLFIETPTLTSLLFAQKKTAAEIEAWDNVWSEISSQVEEKIKQVKEYLKTAKRDEDTSPQEVEEFPRRAAGEPNGVHLDSFYDGRIRADDAALDISRTVQRPNHSNVLLSSRN